MAKITGVYLDKVNNKKDLEGNIDKVLAQLKNTILNDMDLNTAEKYLYWLNQLGADYIKNEKKFNYMSLMRYKRGSVVKANFGFKIGSEQGGLHYAVVLDNRNHKSNKVLMVVPIESLPDGKNPADINKNYEVFLGYGIFKDEIDYVEKRISSLQRKISKLKADKKDCFKQERQLRKLRKELVSLNKGSVAQIAQTCAMSKIRIYNPKHTKDRYSSFILDDDKLNEIERKLKELYFKKTEKNIQKDEESTQNGEKNT